MRLVAACLIMAAMLGCAASVDSAASPRQPAHERAPNQHDWLERRVAELEEDNALLSARMEELRLRCAALTTRLNELQFHARKLEDQAAHLADAPKQRDKFMTMYEQASSENAQLRLEIESLRKQIAELTAP